MTVEVSKVTALHLKRDAYLYVRQSTLRHVIFRGGATTTLTLPLPLNAWPSRIEMATCFTGGHRQFQPKDSCLAGERHAELGHHPGTPHRGVKGPSGRVSERQRTCRHRRRFGEFRRGRSASRGFKFSEEGARADRHHLLELPDRSIVATIEAWLAFLSAALTEIVIPEKSDLFETKRFSWWPAKAPFGHHKPMRLPIRTLAWLFRALLRTRNDLAIENMALRQQLSVYGQLKVKPRLKTEDRASGFFSPWVIKVSERV